MTTQLLVTTSHSILLIEVESREVKTIERGRGLYYGITQRDNHIYVAARRRMVSSPVPVRDEQGEILVLNERLTLVDALAAPFPLRDMHEIKWHGGTLWVTCAFDNMIALFNGETWDKWYPLGKPTAEPYDQHHLNSLFFENETLVVLAHNWGRSALHFFALPTLDPIRTLWLGVEAHNVWTDGGEYCTCSSGEGKLVGDKSFFLSTGGFPRGVAHSNGVRCVGVSERAERIDRDFTSGKIKVHDEEWRALDEITLAGEGLILDLLPYRRPDNEATKG